MRLYFIILILFFSSCMNAKLSKEDLIVFIEDEKNGFKVERKMKEIHYSVQYKPHEYLAAYESLRNSSVSDNGVSIEDFSGLQYFTIIMNAGNDKVDILKEGINNIGEYNARIEYFSYKAQDNCTLIQGHDTLKPVLYHYERPYGISPNHKLLLAFPIVPGSDIESDKVLVYNDQVFGAGKMNFRFQAAKINNIPGLLQ